MVRPGIFTVGGLAFLLKVHRAWDKASPKSPFGSHGEVAVVVAAMWWGSSWLLLRLLDGTTCTEKQLEEMRNVPYREAIGSLHHNAASIASLGGR